MDAPHVERLVTFEVKDVTTGKTLNYMKSAHLPRAGDFLLPEYSVRRLRVLGVEHHTVHANSYDTIVQFPVVLVEEEQG